MADQGAEIPFEAQAERRDLSISVLLVDDQAFVCAAVERLLASEHDIELHCCEKAADAIARANQIEPAVILQDLVLPDIDGLTMVRLFRANPRTATTPIVMLSGSDDPGTRARAMAGGVNDYLVKLPAKSDLVACIRRHASAGIPRSPDRLTASPGPLEGVSAPVTEATLDRRVIAEYRQADASDADDFLLTLIDEFVREATSQVNLLAEAKQRQDAAALKTIAHSLKGSSLTMGANRLAALCAQIESYADRRPSGTVMTVLVSDLAKEFGKVKEALDSERRGASAS